MLFLHGTTDGITLAYFLQHNMAGILVDVHYERGL